MGERVEREVGGGVCRAARCVRRGVDRRVGICLRRNGDRLRERDSEVSLKVFIDLKDGNIDYDFGSGPVEIVQQLLGEEQLVRGRTHDDGVLAGDEVDLDAGVEQVADGDEDFVGIVLLAGVGQVEGLDGLLIEIGALGAGVLGDEDGVGGDGLCRRCRRCVPTMRRASVRLTLVRSTGMRLEV